MFIPDDTSVLFQVVGQVVVVLLAIVGGIKYLEKRQEKKIDERVKDILDPVTNELKSEISIIKHCLQKYQEIGTLTINNLKDSLDRIENNQNNRSKRYDHGRNN